MRRDLEHCDDKGMSIVFTGAMEDCDDNGMEHCNDKGYRAL